MFLGIPPFKTRMSVLYEFSSFRRGAGAGGWMECPGVLGCVVVCQKLSANIFSVVISVVGV